MTTEGRRSLNEMATIGVILILLGIACIAGVFKD